MNRIFLPSLIAVGVLGGCVADEVSPEITSIAKGDKCPDFGCGENSPIAGPFEIPEFHKHGLPNRFGVKFLYFLMGNQMYDVSVVNDHLIALVPGTATIAYQHQALTGGQLVFEHPDYAPTNLPSGKITVTINHVTANGQVFWVGPATGVETYELLYEGAGVTVRTPMCKSPPPEKDGENNQWMNRFESIFFSGDRYDPSDMTVSSSSLGGLPPRAFVDWINIGCAGSVPAKLHFNRHTTASQYSGYTTTIAERQAMLKMYAGDFCGHGTVYTVMGTPIHWTNAKGQSSPTGNQASAEALWSSHGALCMDVHRLSSSADPALLALANGVRLECPALRKCNEVPGYPSQPATPQAILAATGAYVFTQSPAH